MAVRAAPFHRVGDIPAAALRIGCSIRVAEETVHTPDGDVLNLRYLFSPDGSRATPLIDLNDDELVPEEEVASWEHRLKIHIPRP